jgi:hypothetical protein
MTSMLNVEIWASFFSSTAQISGGLVGLVFVALTFKPRMFGAEGDVAMRGLASQVFADFLNVLLVSLLLLTPSPTLVWAGSLLGIVGAAGLARLLRSWLVIGRSRTTARGPVLRRMAMSLGGNFIFATGGAVAWLSPPRVEWFCYCVVTGVLVLILSGSRGAWLLVTHEASP